MDFPLKERSEGVMHGSDGQGKQIPCDRAVVQAILTTFATGCYLSYTILKAVLKPNFQGYM